MKDQITAREAVAEMPIAVSELANPEEEQLARLENCIRQYLPIKLKMK